ncbi:hypothetical protein BpHYR1_023777 [Brachionus plicatilis]|uniref:Uncharacterized protein n=1 Tax=Brachionus plicatilis TaxID=10195 RepID=A0A3M7QDX1_BRAPC|nr:hypothetical protein BpHYR1_023777 [Brachionus plicatilis]
MAESIVSINSTEVESIDSTALKQRFFNPILELKIQWAPDKKRRVKYKPTYESASLCSCSTAVRQYSKKCSTGRVCE